jgi:hypothetical protein
MDSHGKRHFGFCFGGELAKGMIRRGREVADYAFG